MELWVSNALTPNFIVGKATYAKYCLSDTDIAKLWPMGKSNQVWGAERSLDGEGRCVSVRCGVGGNRFAAPH